MHLMAKPLGPKSLLIRQAITAYPDKGNKEIAKLFNDSAARLGRHLFGSRIMPALQLGPDVVHRFLVALSCHRLCVQREALIILGAAYERAKAARPDLWVRRDEVGIIPDDGFNGVFLS